MFQHTTDNLDQILPQLNRLKHDMGAMEQAFQPVLTRAHVCSQSFSDSQALTIPGYGSAAEGKLRGRETVAPNLSRR